MKKRISLIPILLITIFACNEKSSSKDGLNKELLESKTAEFILTHNNTRNFIKSEVGEISEFEVNLLFTKPTLTLKEYLEKQISNNEKLVADYKDDFERTSIMVYKELMNEKIKSVDSLYKILLTTEPSDSVYDCYYYFKNDFKDKGMDEEMIVHWINTVDGKSNILEHLTLIGYDD